MPNLRRIVSRLWSAISHISTLWSILPAKVQEYLQSYLHQLMVATISAVVFGVWAALYRLPPPITGLCVMGAFSIGFLIANQFKHRSHLRLLQSTFTPTRGISEPDLPAATSAHLAGSQFQGLTIFLADLARGTNKIRNKQFERCVIKGPAVINLINNNRIEYSSLGGSGEYRDSYFLEVPDSQRMLTGVIGLENCDFLHCWFVGIAFIGKHDEMTRVRSGFGD